MRKKLDTRFPASRIKKIMQADEDVGKIAMAVPLLVSKALELFLQDLCDRTYEITLQRGAKTMSSLHLKQCVQSFNVFDFLREIVNKVPDLGGSDAVGDDRSITKRRKAAEEEEDSDEELKRTRTLDTVHRSSGRGRGRGQGRGRGRGRARAADRNNTISDKYEDDDLDHISSQHHDKQHLNPERLDNESEAKEITENTVSSSSAVAARTFDLNVELEENEDIALVAAGPTPTPVPEEVKNEEYPGWIDMDLDPIHLTHLNRRPEEDEEDYDEEA